MFWNKKKDIRQRPDDKDLENLLSLYEIKPDCKYIMWFSRPLNSCHITTLRSVAERIGLNKNNFLLIQGVEAPVIFELETGLPS